MRLTLSNHLDRLFGMTESKRKTTKLLKPPVALEEFLFSNPDIAIAFNELPPSEKNKWIKDVWDAKKPESKEKLLEAMVEKLKTTDQG